MSSPDKYLLSGNSMRNLLLEISECPPAEINIGTEQEISQGSAPSFSFLNIQENHGCYVSNNLVLPDTEDCFKGQDSYYILKIHDEWIMFRGKRDINGIVVLRVPVRRKFGRFWKRGLHLWQFNACSHLPPCDNLPQDICDVTWGHKMIYETGVQGKMQ